MAFEGLMHPFGIYYSGVPTSRWRSSSRKPPLISRGWGEAPRPSLHHAEWQGSWRPDVAGDSEGHAAGVREANRRGPEARAKCP